MNGRSGWSDEEHGLAAALRRFPARSLQIRELSIRDESFRGMCEDFAAAENALAHADQLPFHVREERRAEFRSLVESLAAEIEQALGPAKGLI
ncbi:hypothetical protein ILFOPFJJ_00634 [Ensifer psoraleae]|uniref:hypothetical protein n=1 Tax=Sinorhizobium TaxID=28105 RepID=UPI001569F549|nr:MULTISPECIES: hypothetical protein [Sinorhizobium]MDK1386225.1 hypothetical protein [Sinorhizobium sp. 7-81]NRP69761.1 hypothetical protein [Sinorhizobium psoraleae]